MSKRIEIHVVTYNNADLVVRCLRSVLAHLPPPEVYDVRVVVLDNDSPEGPADVVARTFPDLDLVREPMNLWHGPASNKLMARTDADYVLMLNPDTVVREDVVTPLARALDRDPRLIAALPRLVGEDGVRQENSQRFPSLRYELALRLRGTKLDRLAAGSHGSSATVVTGVRDTPPPAHVSYPMEFVWTTCVLLRRAAAVEIGPFDERIPQYDSDLDFSRRAANRGWYAYYAPDLEVVHVGGASTTSAKKRTSERQGRRRYYRHHHGPLTSAFYTAACSAIEGVKELSARRRGPASS